MFVFNVTKTFGKSREEIIGNDEKKNKHLKTALQKLSLNPRHPSLKSHKVNTPNHGIRWSSWVSGDIRIIWDYDSGNRLVILLLDIGSHSGTHNVYK